MKCPQCQTGEVRIIEGAFCMCGNPAFICVECLSFFNVPCHQNKLPPEIELDFDKERTDMFKKISENPPQSKKEKKKKLKPQKPYIPETISIEYYKKNIEQIQKQRKNFMKKVFSTKPNLKTRFKIFLKSIFRR